MDKNNSKIEKKILEMPLLPIDDDYDDDDERGNRVIFFHKIKSINLQQNL